MVQGKMRIYLHGIYIMSFLLLISISYGATITGAVYDQSLNRLSNVVLEIDSSPKQRYVAVNGTYSFEVPPGNYRISFYYQDGKERYASEENITVLGDGEFHIDLFPYPDMIDQQLSDSVDMVIDDPETSEKTGFGMQDLFLPAFFIFLVIFTYFGVQYFSRHGEGKQVTVDAKPGDDKSKVLMYITKNEGRITQKQLRDNFPFSEAKMSLILAELEATGKIKKIKKGRANLILLIK